MEGLRDKSWRWWAVALASAGLAGCGGGGGGGVRNDPPPASASIGFTPNIANDAALGQVNPPTVPGQAPPLTFASGTVAQHLQAINAAGALGAGLKGQGVTIGFLDSGVNRNHPTLSGRVTQNFINVNRSTNDVSVDDKVGHGTTVASLAAGRPAVGNYLNPDGSNSGNTATWGGGVAQDATIVSSRIIGDERPVDDGSGQGNEIRAGDGYGTYFRDLNTQLAVAGAKIINNSWGGLYWTDPALTTELGSAWRDFAISRGGLVVFATGNEGRSNPSDNAALPSIAGPGGSKPAADLERGWLAVTAVDPNNTAQLDRYTTSSGTVNIYPNACGLAKNYCLAAPGTEVYINSAANSQANSGLFRGSGTSYAAPLVSGAAAVVWAAFPYFSNDLVRQTLLGGAKDIGDAGVDDIFGWGLLDVSKSAKGPSQFAWGDVSVSFTGNSAWRNPISGAGGLIKAGSGNLSLTETGTYTGDTRVQAGGLDVRKGLASNVTISSGATLWGSGNFSRNVSNSGNFLNGASSPATIAGNYAQTSTGNLGVWLGSRFSVTGTATLAGQLSILGVKSGYTTTAKETLLTASGGVNGTFVSTKAAPNVFLDATVSYDPNNVYLNITRIDVTKAIAGAGLSVTSLDSAARLEGAMQVIDGQISGATPGGASAGFITAAGGLQQIASMEQAATAVSSLSGELHAAADNLTLDAIDANRQAVGARFAGFAGDSRHVGAWSRRMDDAGHGAAVSGDFAASGWAMGQDVALAKGWVSGLAFGETYAYGRGGAGRDRSRDRQVQSQIYMGRGVGASYAVAQLSAGQYARQMQRQLLLGASRQGVASDYSGKFWSAGFEAGHRFDWRDVALTPYVGMDFVQIRRDGFIESGAEGFGLRANAIAASRNQLLAGVRLQQQWGDMSLRAYAEWQNVFAAEGFDRQASFVGVDAWAPLANLNAGRSGGLYGFGLDKRLSNAARLSFGFDQRVGPRGHARMLSAKYRHDF